MSLISVENKPSALSAWYAVIVLLFAYVLSFVDRIIMSLLVIPIQKDLDISDTQMGLLMGLAFAIFYTVVGIPIARLSDVKSRKIIVSIGIFLWSIMTAVCGLARSFLELFLARIGVGVGEATLSPAAYSMIADYFPENKLGKAIAVYQSGALFGSGIAFIIGGAIVGLIVNSSATSLPFLGELQPWQLAFIIVGLPGVLMALVMLSVKEPKRTGIKKDLGTSVTIKDAVRYMVKNSKVYLSVFIGFSMLAIPITTIFTWYPTYLQRIHDLTIGESGKILGLILFFLSSSGVFFGGWLVDFLKRRNYQDSFFRVGLIAAITPVPFTLFVSSMSDIDATIILLCPFIFLASMPLAIGPIVLQIISPNQLRAQTGAIYMLFMNLLTAAIATSGIGFITDYIFENPLDVGQSIMIVNIVSAPVAFLALSYGLFHYNKTLTKE
ncbi:MAG: MFS transporter [Gammaproteobacteria bacterium]|nr:MFS transporter [Gammaproteobacteria bacterium]MBT5217121.1 MFS transporter [Gammaproteobacteria bacterium]MDG2434235.1 MFS transporter [Gammaproteobacteria bacterium]